MNSMMRKSLFRQDSEPKNGLVNDIWEKSVSNEFFKPMSVRKLNSYPRSMLEYILSSMNDFIIVNRTTNKRKK